jgi:hypothetical protein
MDELFGEITAATGVSTETARRSAAIILAFIAHEAPAAATGPLFDRLPGARDLAAEAGPSSGGGVFGVFNDLTGAGLGMAEIQLAALTFLNFARAKAGAREVDAVVASIPGLDQFI